MALGQTFPTPETVAQHVADTLAAAEFLPLDVVELHAVAARLFWHGGDLNRAIGDETDPACRGAGYWGLLTYSVALRDVGQPERIAARHASTAASIDKSIAGRLVIIAEKRARAKTIQGYDPGNAAILSGEADRLAKSITDQKSAAAQLRARAAELVAVKRAA